MASGNEDSKSEFDDPFQMVGRTRDEDMQAMARRIVQLLEISDQDVVLDIGAGTGLITTEVAKFAKHVVGFDRSSENIALAQRSKPKNLTYVLGDALSLSTNLNLADFTKIFSFGLFQFFGPNQTKAILSQVKNLSRPRWFLVGDIPDAERKNVYYDTYSKRAIQWANFKLNQALGWSPYPVMGYWYSKDEYRMLASSVGLKMTVPPPLASWKVSRYRFDALLKPEIDC